MRRSRRRPIRFCPQQPVRSLRCRRQFRRNHPQSTSAMTAAPRQLVFDLAHRQALGAEDFLVSSSNDAAVEMVDRWPDWPNPAAIVAGPQGSGKSHLANVWRLRSGAGLVTAAALDDAHVAALQPGAALVVEDLDCGLADEKVLFHLLNRARESKLSV